SAQCARIGRAEQMAVHDDDVEPLLLQPHLILDPLAERMRVRVAEDGVHRRNRLQLHQYIQRADVACVQYDVDAREHAEDLRAQQAVRVPDQTYLHDSPDCHCGPMLLGTPTCASTRRTMKSTRSSMPCGL